MTLASRLTGCILAALCSSAWGATAGDIDIRSPKDQKVFCNYNIFLVGNTSWSVDNVGRTLSVAIDRIDNLCSDTSGTIQIRALISATPVTPAGQYTSFTLGQFSLPGLPSNGFYTNVNQTVPLNAPSDGTYYLYIVAYENECGLNCYAIDDYVEIFDRIKVVGGQFSLDNPTHHTSQAVEYLHAGFGHYFVTAQGDEIAGLDAGVFAGWARTGQAWKIYNYGPDVHDLCRFFTVFFAPKSSHFYTAVATECDWVKGNPVWSYEKVAGKVGLPDAGGQCAAGQVPLYRVYNEGMTGAPNHRYSTSLAIRAEMIAQGYVPEDPNNVCVPQ